MRVSVTECTTVYESVVRKRMEGCKNGISKTVSMNGSFFPSLFYSFFYSLAWSPKSPGRLVACSDVLDLLSRSSVIRNRRETWKRQKIKIIVINKQTKTAASFGLGYGNMVDVYCGGNSSRSCFVLWAISETFWLQLMDPTLIDTVCLQTRVCLLLLRIQ